MKKTKFKYKIEKRPTLWVIKMSKGEYSDRREEFKLIAANNPEECWYFLKQYMICEEYDDPEFMFLYDDDYDIVERFKIPTNRDEFYNSDVDIEDKDPGYGVWRVIIKMSEVITPLKLE